MSKCNNNYIIILQKTSLVLACLLFSNLIFSQKVIRGKVVDKDNSPLEFATLILKSDLTLISSALSDSVGNFKFTNLTDERYTLICNYLSFNKKEVSFVLKKDTSLFFMMDSVLNNLKEVVVSGKQPIFERKIDRFVFNVSNSAILQGGNALDALQQTPTVKVSNESIGLAGKSTVAIMLNDKLIQISGSDLINFLKSISVSDISKIEIITNPPSKYDAEGNSGLINIVTKSVGINNYYSALVQLSMRQSTYSTLGGGAGFNFKKNNLYFSTGFNLNNGSVAPLEQMSIYYPTHSWIQRSERIDYSKNTSGRVTAEYQLKKSKIGFQYLGGYSMPDIKEKITIKSLDNSNNLDSTIYTNAYKKAISKYNSLSLNYSCNLDTLGKKVSVDASYWSGTNENKRPFSGFTSNSTGITNPYSLYENETNSTQQISILTSKIDFEVPNKIVNLSFGGKLSISNTKSNNSFYKIINNDYLIDYSKTDSYNYRENTEAVYLSLNKSFKKIEIQSGLRGEYTETTGISYAYNQVNKNFYFRLFPTLFLKYVPNKTNTFSLNYNKRIGRPSYRWLNPFKWYLNNNTYSEGNPFLQPVYAHNFEIAHLFKDNLNTSLYFNAIENGYNQLTFVSNSTNDIVLKPVNFFKNYTWGITESYSINKWDRFSSNLELELSYSLTKSSNPNTINKFENFTTYVSSYSTYMLNKNKTIFIELNAWYQFPQIIGTLKAGANSSVDIGAKYLLVKRKLSVGVNIIDIFKKSVSPLYNTINSINQSFVNYYDNRQLKISISYNFGNIKIKNKTINQSNDEEKRRTN